MKISAGRIIFFVAMCLLAEPVAVLAHELSGYVSAEGRFFFNDPALSEQERDNGSFAFQPEYYHEWEDGSAFLFVPFGRLDSADSERTHFDVRELNYLWPTDDWELRLGVGKVFWGVTEFVHLVDIINQTDLVENIDEEDKLGQPMVHLSVPRDWGVLDLFLLPFFRERTFPGRKGRLRNALVVDTDHPIYESDSEEHHVDFAARYSNTIGDWDFGIYHFVGTGREPTLLPGIDKKGRAVLIPFYEQINQTGLDVQLVAGQWLWKLESLYRTGQGDSLFASVAGCEYTVVGLADSGMDLGLLGEYAFDDRRDDAPTVYENDLMIGLRLAVNDADGSEILAGLIQDLDSRSRALSIEASRRFGSNWKLSLQAWGFLDSAADDLLFNARDDDFLQVELAYYF
ncbi:MAG: hypothetical protein JSW59_01070 [Phycisphaerales bacterium]|nr:MAG: hypothetical protein JSW59_01070 [Phycisphaerales bacterium]